MHKDLPGWTIFQILNTDMLRVTDCLFLLRSGYMFPAVSQQPGAAMFFSLQLSAARTSRQRKPNLRS